MSPHAEYFFQLAGNQLWQVTLLMLIVGLFDLDGDGKSDRKELHNLIGSYGGSVDVETDERGNIRGSGMSVSTKFLIVGEIPASSQQMQRQHKRMTESARELGVRIVTMKQFLQFMAYDPPAKPPRLQSVVTGTQSYKRPSVDE